MIILFIDESMLRLHAKVLWPEDDNVDDYGSSNYLFRIYDKDNNNNIKTDKESSLVHVTSIVFNI